MDSSQEKTLNNYIDLLANEDCFEASEFIKQSLKSEMYGTKGIVKIYRDTFEITRQDLISELSDQFLADTNLSVDEAVEKYTSSVYQINNNIQSQIKLNILQFVQSNNNYLSKDYPSSVEVAQFLLRENSDSIQTLIQNRLLTIFNEILFMSARQSGVSNAGNTGEDFVALILESIGLNEGVGYRRELKTQKGANTDIVIPFVEDFEEHKVKAYCAVQFSTNDRLRMVGGELKHGAKTYTILGSGLPASSKNCDAIGIGHLRNVKEKNIKLVIYEFERQRLIKKLEEKSKVKNKDGKPNKGNKEALEKLNIYRDYSISFSKFSQEIEDLGIA